MSVTDGGDSTIRLTGEDGTVLYEGPGRVVYDVPVGERPVLTGVQAPEDGDPLSWGISFDDLCPGRAPGEPTMAQVVRWQGLMESGREGAEFMAIRDMEQAGIAVAAVDATVLRAVQDYGLPEEVLGAPPRTILGNLSTVPADRLEENERLIARTRAEFPSDPYEYGRVHPEGPMHWTPPADNDGGVPSCPA